MGRYKCSHRKCTQRLEIIPGDYSGIEIATSRSQDGDDLGAWVYLTDVDALELAKEILEHVHSSVKLNSSFGKAGD